jgi:hypothetical protein
MGAAGPVHGFDAGVDVLGLSEESKLTDRFDQFGNLHRTLQVTGLLKEEKQPRPACEVAP